MKETWKKLVQTLKSSGSQKFDGVQIAIKAKYGYQFNSYQEVLDYKISKIEDQIKLKIEFSRDERLLVLLVSEDQEELYQDIAEHFREKDFDTFFASGKELEGLKNKKYLFISWDI